MEKINKYIKILELDKILTMLAELTCCQSAHERSINIKPLYDLNSVLLEINKTSEAFMLSTKYGTPSFYNIINPDLQIKRAISGGSLNCSELNNIANIIKCSRLLKEWYRECSTLNKSLDIMFSNLVINKELENNIFNCILSDDEISDNASEELYNIRKNIKNNSFKAREKLDTIVKSSNYQKYLQDSIITIREGRFVIPVKAEYKNEISGIVHDSSASGSTLFIEPIKILEINNNIKILQRKEKEEIERILYKLSKECGDFSEYILNDFNLIVDLNICFSKANLACNMNAFVPKINECGKIRINNARHPLIDKNKVVPISVSLGYDYNCLIITGPNTGGKTAALKTVGLLTLMVMCGLMIPVSDDSEISIFENILVDIGDEQSIQNNLSTFSSHMTNIVSIINSANEKSLVLLDELGSGTDPIEGSALAIAIIENLKAKSSISMITTHYSELKKYAIKTESIENACFEFDIEKLKPTYKLLIGSPGKSNAFYISERLGLKREIINFAKTLISDEDKKFEDVVESLENSRKNYEKLYYEYNCKNIELEKLKKDIEITKSSIEKSKNRELELAKQQASSIVEDVRLNANLLFDEIKNIKKDISNNSYSSNYQYSTLRKKVDMLHDKANPVIAKKSEKYILPRKLKIGDNVLIFDIDKKGIVLSLPDKSENVFVQSGIIKTKVHISNIRLLEQQNVTFKREVTKDLKRKVDRNISTEIDLRGCTVEEALLEIDMFIDNCILTNINKITIIHGKGSGILRREIHKYLKSNKHIKTYRLGIFGEGESGVTIAEIK